MEEFLERVESEEEGSPLDMEPEEAAFEQSRPAEAAEAEAAAETPAADASDAVKAEAPPAQPDLAARLAAEFAAMREEFPELREFRDVPDTVVRMAAAGMPLTDAYLRFCYREQRRVAEEQRQREQSRRQAAGTLRDVPERADGYDAVFAAAFRGALR